MNDDFDSSANGASSRVARNGTALLSSVVLASPEIAHQFPQDIFDKLGSTVNYARSLDDLANLVSGQEADLALLPLMFGDHSTLPFIADIMRSQPNCAIVVTAKNDQINEAAEAMRLGAEDCLFVPFTKKHLEKTISAALQRIRQRRFNLKGEDTSARLRTTSAQQHTDPSGQSHHSADHPTPVSERRHGMIFSDISMQPVHDLLNSVASSTAPIFIRGETGTGKELLAHAIHAESGRASHPIVVVDCSRLQTETMASELFGYLKGAFPGAKAEKVGAVETANRGTLFLDEIANANLDVQKQLVRFLESGEFYPLGESKPIKTNARIICSTSADPMKEIAKGNLREDLFYRLHVVPITLPALRHRGEDILSIAMAKLTQMARQEGRKFRAFAPDAIELLRSYSWPGNIRQLTNIIWNVVLQNDGDVVTAAMLSRDINQTIKDAEEQKTTGSLGQLDLEGRTLAEIERRVIERTIRAQGGSVPRAAKILDVSPSTIYRKLENWK